MSIPVIAIIVCHGDIYDACILHLNIIGLGRLTRFQGSLMKGKIP